MEDAEEGLGPIRKTKKKAHTKPNLDSFRFSMEKYELQLYSKFKNRLRFYFKPKPRTKKRKTDNRKNKQIKPGKNKNK